MVVFAELTELRPFPQLPSMHSDLIKKGGEGMSNWKSIIALVVVVAIAAGGFVYLLTRNSGGKTDIIVNVEDIKKIAQLATVEYYVSVYVHEEKERAKYEWLKAEYFVFMKGKVTEV